LWGLFLLGYVLGSRDEGELVPKMVWRVKLVAELEPGLLLVAGFQAGQARWNVNGPSKMRSRNVDAAIQ